MKPEKANQAWYGNNIGTKAYILDFNFGKIKDQKRQSNMLRQKGEVWQGNGNIRSQKWQIRQYEDADDWTN